MICKVFWWNIFRFFCFLGGLNFLDFVVDVMDLNVWCYGDCVKNYFVSLWNGNVDGLWLCEVKVDWVEILVLFVVDLSGMEWGYFLDVDWIKVFL